MSATVLRAAPICRAAQQSVRSLRTMPASVLGRNLGRWSTFRATVVADSFSGRIATARCISQSSKDKVKQRKSTITIEERVKKIVADQLGVKAEEVTVEKSFVDDLGADSLDTVELVMALEESFDLEIPDEEAEKITTVQAAIDYIRYRWN